jgi:nucleotide-binding universal stress UspA family protein
MVRIKKILLAVEGLARADAVAKLVAHTARRANGTVRLLHVASQPLAVQDDEGQVVALAESKATGRTSQGLDFLQTLEVHFDGAPVQSVVRFGDPTVQILDEAEAFGADLILVFTTCLIGQRGRTCLRERGHARDARAANGNHCGLEESVP